MVDDTKQLIFKCRGTASNADDRSDAFKTRANS
jgi:hypothetical protein